MDGLTARERAKRRRVERERTRRLIAAAIDVGATSWRDVGAQVGVSHETARRWGHRMGLRTPAMRRALVLSEAVTFWCDRVMAGRIDELVARSGRSRADVVRGLVGEALFARDVGNAREANPTSPQPAPRV